MKSRSTCTSCRTKLAVLCTLQVAPCEHFWKILRSSYSLILPFVLFDEASEKSWLRFYPSYMSLQASTWAAEGIFTFGLSKFPVGTDMILLTRAVIDVLIRGHSRNQWGYRGIYVYWVPSVSCLEEFCDKSIRLCVTHTWNMASSLPHKFIFICPEILSADNLKRHVMFPLMMSLSSCCLWLVASLFRPEMQWELD